LRTNSSDPGEKSPTAHCGDHGRACTGSDEVLLLAMSMTPDE
jgi:hypothetical protein